MPDKILLRVDGEVDRPQEYRYADLVAIPADFQVADVTRFGARRGGDAVLLKGLLAAAGVRPSGRYLGLHSESDNFHASIPLAPILDKAFLIYRHGGQPLAVDTGGPLRFFVPDHAECHAEEIDECANVKFVEHLEVTANRGFDNRPQDDESHERLHRGQ